MKSSEEELLADFSKEFEEKLISISAQMLKEEIDRRILIDFKKIQYKKILNKYFIIF